MGLWCIVLTEAEARDVRGPYSATSALDPRAATDGTWLLPLRVMADVADVAPALVSKLWPKSLRETVPQDFVGGEAIDQEQLALVDAAEAAWFASMAFAEDDPRAALLAEIRAAVAAVNAQKG